MQENKTSNEVIVASVSSVFPSRSGNRRIIVRFKGGLKPWHAYMKPDGTQHHPEGHLKKTKKDQPVVLDQDEFNWCFDKWSQDKKLGVKKECFIEGQVFEQAKALYFKVKAEEEYKVKLAEKRAQQEAKKVVINSLPKASSKKEGGNNGKKKFSFFEGLCAIRERLTA